MGAPENESFQYACRSAIAIMEWMHCAYVIMQSQCLHQRIVAPEFPV